VFSSDAISRFLFPGTVFVETSEEECPVAGKYPVPFTVALVISSIERSAIGVIGHRRDRPTVARTMSLPIMPVRLA
jgi:hypothetical protein